MHTRAAHLISSLELVPHPEGGYFREVYRSGSPVQPIDARATRRALTTIYFLLVAGQVSRWHRVVSDEVWHYYEGDALELLTVDDVFNRVTRTGLGRLDDGVKPVHVVVSNAWQAARPLGAYTLAGCTVGPGFEYEDFEMLRGRPAEAEALRNRHPDVADLI